MKTLGGAGGAGGAAQRSARKRKQRKHTGGAKWNAAQPHSSENRASRLYLAGALAKASAAAASISISIQRNIGCALLIGVVLTWLPFPHDRDSIPDYSIAATLLVFCVYYWYSDAFWPELSTMTSLTNHVVSQYFHYILFCWYDSHSCDLLCYYSKCYLFIVK